MKSGFIRIFQNWRYLNLWDFVRIYSRLFNNFLIQDTCKSKIYLNKIENKIVFVQENIFLVGRDGRVGFCDNVNPWETQRRRTRVTGCGNRLCENSQFPEQQSKNQGRTETMWHGFSNVEVPEIRQPRSRYSTHWMHSAMLRSGTWKQYKTSQYIHIESTFPKPTPKSQEFFFSK